MPDTLIKERNSFDRDRERYVFLISDLNSIGSFPSSMLDQ